MKQYLWSLIVVAGCTAAPSPEAPVGTPVKRGDLVYSGSFYGEVEARNKQPLLAPSFANTAGSASG